MYRPVPSVKPSRELVTQAAAGTDRIWQRYPASVVGAPSILMHDNYLNIDMLASIPEGDYRTASFAAWAGTRHSREPGHPLYIRQQIVQAGVDPGGKLRYFLGIGHTSPADMARLGVELDNIPIHLALVLFLMSSEHAGQEKSTRFQKGFANKPLLPLAPYLPADLPLELSMEIETQYQMLGTLALQSYTTARDAVLARFADFYQIDKDVNSQVNTLMSRALDCARVFLLMGQGTGMSFMASARESSRIIAQLKAYPGEYYPRFADALENFFAPEIDVKELTGYGGEAAQLIRHTEPQLHNISNMQRLDQYLLEHTDFATILKAQGFQGARAQNVQKLPQEITIGKRLATQYILVSHPGLEPQIVIDWLYRLPAQVLEDIGHIIFSGIDVNHELPRMAAVTNSTLIFNTTIGVNRDLARHRGGGGRFEPVPTFNGVPMNYESAMSVVNMGYVLPIHLSQVEQFSDLSQMFNLQMQDYYAQLTDFLGKIHLHLGDSIDYGFILNLLPLGHYVPLWMHFHAAQALYFPDRRVRNGGDYSYRKLAYDSNRLLASTDEIMGAIAFPPELEPDFLSREQFLDRG